MTARRIQHDLHEARCSCGRLHLAARPDGVPDSAVSIGPNLRALAVYLVVFQHVPIERCARLIADMTGAEVSAGFVHTCLARAAEVVAEVIKLIKTLITAAYVAGFDETTLRCGPPGPKRTCWRRSPSCTRCSSWASGPWSRSASSASCPPSPGWWSPTGTRTTSTAAGSTWLAIRPAWPT